MKGTKKEKLLAFLIFAAMIGLIAIMVVDLLPLFREVISDADDESRMAQYIGSYGAKGVPILMGLQALQIIVAVIPSAVIQVLTGLCYGVWWGTLINLVGCVFGNLLVFISVRQLKNLLEPAVQRMSKRKEMHYLDKLSQIKKPEMIAFAFFLIPGIPNGIMPYLFARTNISQGRYVLAILAGSIPSTFICTYMGDRLSKGSYTAALVIAAAVAVIVGVVLAYKNKIIASVTKKCGGTGPEGTEAPPDDKHDKTQTV